MEASVNRITTIIAILYGKKAELVVNHSQERCYLFFDGFPQDLKIYYEDVDVLEYNQIIDLDSGCDEEGYITSVYVLSSLANQRIKEITAGNRRLMLKGV